MVLQFDNLLLTIRNPFVSPKAEQRNSLLSPHTTLQEGLSSNKIHSRPASLITESCADLVLSNTHCLIQYLLIKCSIVVFVFWKVIKIAWACLVKIKDNITLQTLITKHELDTYYEQSTA